MTVRKVTISIDKALLDEFELLAEREGQSRSEAIVVSMQHAIRQRKLRDAVELGLTETGGPTTTGEKSKARQRLGVEKR